MRLMEPTTSVSVVVTFLRMDEAPAQAGPALPEGVRVDRLAPRCSLAQYRELYAGVGQDYLWWLRRTLPDAEMEEILADRRISISVLRDAEGDLGFYELDRRSPHRMINLAYFGLLPRAIGRGLGMAFLHHAINAACAEGCSALTVNTCTADHPRALPNYLRAGFRKLRQVVEIWPIPNRLGLPMPRHMQAGTPSGLPPAPGRT